MTRPFFAKSLLAALLLAAFTFSANAQNDAAPVKAPKPTTTKRAKPAPAPAPADGQQPAPAERPQPAPGAQRGDNYATELNLTEEQKAKFKKADEDYAAQRRANKAAKKEDNETLRQARIKAHREALNADQLKKYDEMLAKKEARRAANEQKRAEMKTAKKAEKGAKKEQKAEKKAIKEELKKQ